VQIEARLPVLQEGFTNPRENRWATGRENSGRKQQRGVVPFPRKSRQKLSLFWATVRDQRLESTPLFWATVRDQRLESTPLKSLNADSMFEAEFAQPKEIPVNQGHDDFERLEAMRRNTFRPRENRWATGRENSGRKQQRGVVPFPRQPPTAGLTALPGAVNGRSTAMLLVLAVHHVRAAGRLGSHMQRHSHSGAPEDDDERSNDDDDDDSYYYDCCRCLAMLSAMERKPEELLADAQHSNGTQRVTEKRSRQQPLFFTCSSTAGMWEENKCAGSDPSSFMLADSSWRSSPNETMRSQPGRLMAENSVLGKPRADAPPEKALQTTSDLVCTVEIIEML
ncbi:unnamed protein product, partial [Symbiodinium microadriaticum]